MKSRRQPSSQVAKRLSANDLGRTGSHQAGILVPKRGEILAFFPPLEMTSLNPRVKLVASVDGSSEVFDLAFIYYNNKLFGTGTRNEYRLTGLTRLLRALEADIGDTLLLKWAAGDHLTASLARTTDAEGADLKISATSNNQWTIVEVTGE